MKNVLIAFALVWSAHFGNVQAAIVVRSFSDMPSDATTIFPDPFLSHIELEADYGIRLDSWNNANELRDGFWENTTPSAYSAFSDSFRSNPVAPFGRSVALAGLRLTFSDPVYAFGATQVVTHPDSGLTAIGNALFELIAYDANGEVIESALWSRFGERRGPLVYVIGGILASYAGVLSDVPIHQVTMIGARPSTGDLISATGSISFSSTPIIPEPASVFVWALLVGCVGFVFLIHRSDRLN